MSCKFKQMSCERSPGTAAGPAPRFFFHWVFSGFFFCFFHFFFFFEEKGKIPTASVLVKHFGFFPVSGCLLWGW